MINENDLEIIIEHSCSIHGNETQFQTLLKAAIYDVVYKATFKDSVEKDIESFLEEFEISGSTLWRWMQGTSVPHPNVQKLVEAWCDKQIKGNVK